MKAATPDASPYKGLTPYSEADSRFFFGREREREIVAANLLASRLTVLYGPSGVGKSSLLRAGVAHDLHCQSRDNLAKLGKPKFALAVFPNLDDDGKLGSWRYDPADELARCIEKAVAGALAASGTEHKNATQPLADVLKEGTKRLEGKILVILDQFEEYFLYHSQEKGDGNFAAELARALSQPDLRVNFLIGIREDAYAKLDHFKGRIPRLYDNYLRIDHLDRASARAAIEQPLEHYNRLVADCGEPIRIQPALVEAVLDQVEIGKVRLAEAGRGTVQDANGAAPEARIETPYLQLVMSQMWTAENNAQSRVLRLETFDALGKAEGIVRAHLQNSLATLTEREKDIASQVFNYLVTPRGAKIAQEACALADYTNEAPTSVTALLEKLAGGGFRILRAVGQPGDGRSTCFEIFHDVLAPAILEWRARRQSEQARTAAEQRTAAEAAAKAAEARRRYEIDSANALAAAEKRTSRHLRKILLGTLAMALVAILGGGVAAHQKTRAEALHEIDDWNREGWNRYRINDQHGALKSFEEARKSYENWGDHEGAVATLVNMGATDAIERQFDRAIQGYTKALAELRDLKRREEPLHTQQDEMYLLLRIGDAYKDSNRAQEAKGYFMDAIVLARTATDKKGGPDTAGEAYAVFKIGVIEDEAGHDSRAQEWYREALQLQQKFGDRKGEAETLERIASAYCDLDLKKYAPEWYWRALEVRRQLHDRQGEARLLRTLALLYDNLGLAEQARQAAEQALPLQQSLRDRRERALSLFHLASLHDEMHQSNEAISRYEEALALWQQLGYRREQIDTLKRLADAHRVRGNLDQARAYLAKSQETRLSLTTLVAGEAAER